LGKKPVNNKQMTFWGKPGNQQTNDVSGKTRWPTNKWHHGKILVDNQ